MESLAFLHAATAYEDPNPAPQFRPLPQVSWKQATPVWLGALSIAVALSVISIAPNASAQVLDVGDQGADVSALQRALGSIPVDGVYGSQTEGAVREYQRSRGLVVDGIAGPQTLASLGLVAVGNDDDDFFYVRPGNDDFFFVQPQGGPYVVAVPGGSGILSAVSRIAPGARLQESDRGEFVNAGNFPTREAAAREVERLQSAGISNARVDFQP